MGFLERNLSGPWEMQDLPCLGARSYTSVPENPNANPEEKLRAQPPSRRDKTTTHPSLGGRAGKAWGAGFAKILPSYDPFW